MKLNIFVAGCWGNEKVSTVRVLNENGYDAHDFRKPTLKEDGFSWADVDEDWESWTQEEYFKALSNPIVLKGFNKEFGAMTGADVCVLVAPCVRSSYLEAGYFVGAKKRLIILDCACQPELMYLMADSVCKNIDEVLEALKNYRL